MKHNPFSEPFRNKAATRVALFLFVFLIAVFFSPFQSSAAINQQMNYQGKLTNGSNVAVADGTYNMEFKLYTAPSGGTAIWTETRTGANKVQVTSGLFSVMLGSVASLLGINFNQTLYLGVNIGGTGSPSWDGEMSPRKILGTVPAAFEALNLGGASSTQYVRADQPGTIASSSASTLFTLNQTGVGNAFNIVNGATNIFSVLSGGNVGIGTSTPATALSVIGDSTFSGNITTTGGDIILPISHVLTLGTTYSGITLGQASGSGDFQIKNIGGMSTPFTISGSSNKATFAYQAIFQGGINISDNQNIQLGTTNGTKIGTSASQKIGFFNATPIVQPSSTTDLRQALISLGLYATGGATPLDLNGGAFTAASGNFSGALTFNGPLTVNGSAGTSGSILKSNGSSTAPSWVATSTLGFGTGTVNNGTAGYFAYYQSTGTTVSGQGALYTDGLGSIGIETNSPEATLDVGGSSVIGRSLGFGADSTLYNSDESKSLTLHVDEGGLLQPYPGGVATRLISDGAPLAVYTDDNNFLSFGTNGTEAMHITAGGAVGIATANPLSALSVNGGVAVGSYAGSSGAPAGGLIVSGNVGVGTTNPATKLEVNGSIFANSNLAFIKVGNTNALYFQGDYPGSGEIAAGAYGGSDTGSYSILPSASNGATGAKVGMFYYNGSAFKSAVEVANTSGGTAGNLLLMKSGGNVGIGTTTPNAKLSIVGTSGSAAQLFDIATSTGASYFHVMSNGNIGIATSSPNTLFTVAGQSNFTNALNFNGNPGTSGFILKSNGSGTAPSWISTSTLAVALSDTTGTLAVNRGGTGTSTLPTNGSLLIGNGSGYSLAGLTGTANEIVVTNATGTITLATPQAIGTASAPQFARLGLGAAADASIILSATRNTAGTTTVARLLNSATAATTNGSLLMFNDLRTTGGATDVASIGGLITDITNTAYKGALAFYTANNNTPLERMRIDYQGNVGIGTTTSNFLLTVAGSSNFTNALNFNGNAGTSGQILQSTGSGSAPTWVATSSLGISGSQWTTSGSNIYYNSGNVGIGTTTPMSSLHTTGAITTTGGSSVTGSTPALSFYYNTGSDTGTIDSKADGVAWKPLTIRSNTFSVLSQGGTQGLFQDSVGNVGIGTSTPVSKLSIGGDINFTGALKTSGNAGTSGYILRSNGSGTAPIWTNSLSSLSIDGLTVTTSVGGSGFFTAVDNEIENHISSLDTLNIGNSNNTLGNTDLAVGSSNYSYGTHGFHNEQPAIAMGIANDIEGATAFGFGSGNEVYADDSGTLGLYNVVNGVSSLAIGVDQEVDDDNTIAIGNDVNSITLNTNGLSLHGGSYYGDGSQLTGVSDKNAKTNYTDLNKQDVLQKIDSLNIQQWTYKDHPGVNHVGPYAQDFYSAFHLGNDDKSISFIDPSGIALVGVQAVSEKLDAFTASTTDSLKIINDELSYLAKANIKSVPTAVIDPSDIFAAIQSFGSKVEDGIAYLKNVFVQNLTTQNFTIKGKDITKTGFTIYDRKTKEPLCVYFEDGEQKVEKGACEDSVGTSTDDVIPTVPVVTPIDQDNPDLSASTTSETEGSSTPVLEPTDDDDNDTPVKPTIKPIESPVVIPTDNPISQPTNTDSGDEDDSSKPKDDDSPVSDISKDASSVSSDAPSTPSAPEVSAPSL